MENYFAFYDLPFCLYVDQELLRKQFYTLSRKYHPDLHAQDSNEIQDEILQKSTLNNKAFASLSNKDNRIKYILEFKGLLTEGQNKIPQDFLMEMMDFNEELMELQMDYNEEVKNQLQQKLSNLSNTLSGSIAHLDQEGILLDDTALEQLKNYYLKNQYLKNLFKKIDEIS